MTGEKAPRLAHAKSRGGCQRCKARKVKCNEARPSCAGCQRHGVSCEYVTPGARVPGARVRGPSSRTSNDTSEDGVDHQSVSPPYAFVPFDPDETKERRLVELELFHHYGAVIIHEPFLATHDRDVQEMWKIHVPQLAIHQSHLLNAVLSLSALHLSILHPERTDYANTHRRYFNKTVIEHRHAVANICQDNADAVCLTGSLVSVQAFVLLREDSSTSNYSLPLHWFRLSTGTKTIYKQAWPFIAENGKALPAARAAPSLSNAEARFFQKQHCSQFTSLLTSNENHVDQKAYEDALSYVGYLEKYINSGAGASEVRRLLAGFAALVPSRYVELLEKREPQALVILAYYFSLVKSADSVWWMRGAAEREVYGLQSIIPEEWQWAMAWPLEKLDFFKINPNFTIEATI